MYVKKYFYSNVFPLLSHHRHCGSIDPAKKGPCILVSTDTLKRRNFRPTIKTYSTTIEQQQMAPQQQQIPIQTISENLERIKNGLESAGPMVTTTG